MEEKSLHERSTQSLAERGNAGLIYPGHVSAGINDVTFNGPNASELSVVSFVLGKEGGTEGGATDAAPDECRRLGVVSRFFFGDWRIG
jgi:hypothetical protein